MANDPSRPQRRMPTANALYDALAAAVNDLGEIRAVCERCYAYSRNPQVPVREMWVSGEFPVALGTVMALTWQALDRLELTWGLVPDFGEQQRVERGRTLMQEFRRELHQRFGGGADAEALRKALAFCRNVAEEELAHPDVHVRTEVALKHIALKAREVIGEE